MLQYAVSQLPGAAITSLGWGAVIAVRAMWKEFKRGRREEYALKKMGIERGFSLSQDPDGFHMDAPRRQHRLRATRNPKTDRE